MLHIDEIPEDAKLILHKRVNPEIYEVHAGKIEQAKNMIFSTRNEKFAERFVKAFNEK